MTSLLLVSNCGCKSVSGSMLSTQKTPWQRRDPKSFIGNSLGPSLFLLPGCSCEWCKACRLTQLKPRVAAQCLSWHAPTVRAVVSTGDDCAAGPPKLGGMLNPPAPGPPAPKLGKPGGLRSNVFKVGTFLPATHKTICTTIPRDGTPLRITQGL